MTPVTRLRDSILSLGIRTDRGSHNSLNTFLSLLFPLSLLFRPFFPLLLHSKQPFCFNFHKPPFFSHKNTIFAQPKPSLSPKNPTSINTHKQKLVLHIINLPKTHFNTQKSSPSSHIRKSLLTLQQFELHHKLQPKLQFLHHPSPKIRTHT